MKPSKSYPLQHSTEGDIKMSRVETKAREGYSYDVCGTNETTCVSPRKCVNADSLLECVGQSGCVCLDKSSIGCDGSNNCLPGDRCMKQSSTNHHFCYSCSLVDTGILNATKADRGYSCSKLFTHFCISSQALQSFPSSSLIYRKHLMTTVLCDKHGSCATPQHIILFHSYAMTMSTYCARHGNCSVSTMLVNSPKMAIGLRIGSNTVGLYYTPFAASFGTRIEQLILSFLVSLGL